jgi:hypothetical protein
VDSFSFLSLKKYASFSLAHCDAVKVEEESIPLLLADSSRPSFMRYNGG